MIAKKIPAILVSFFLATNAYGNLALQGILKTQHGRELLARVTKIPQDKIAALRMSEQLSLYRAEAERPWDVFEDINLSGSASIEEIGEALSLAVFIGNVPLYREQIIKLLHVSLLELNSMKQKDIFSEKVLKWDQIPY